MADIKLTPVEAPVLGTSDYGKNINDQFKNIDNNFKLVSNRDFVKGDSGESLYIENVKITKDGKGVGRELYNALKTAIEKTFDSDSKGALNPVGDYSWDDAITQVSATDEEAGEGEDKKSGIYVPIIISENKTTGEVEYICAASPVMLFDNRFNKDAIENVNFSNYEDVVDVTSILNFKKDGYGNWVCELNLSYPRLQYENGSFCWVINNENTIVKSTGIKGDPGESANIWIVQTEEFSDNFTGETVGIGKYFVDSEWVLEAPKNIKDGDLAIVYCESEAKEYYGFFVSQIKIEDGNNTVVYNPKANIQNINYMKNTTEFFKSLGDSNAARGMFLKFDPGTPNSKESHIFYNAGEKLYIKPTKDYSSLENYNGKEKPSINIAGYSTTNINSKKINISANEDIEIIKTEEQQGHIKLVSGHQMSMTSKEGMDLMDDTRILIKSNNIKINGATELNNSLNVTNGDLRVSDGNLIVETGSTELQNGLNVTNGDLRVSDGNLIVETGSTELQNGLKVTNGDLRVSDGNLIVETGSTELQNGLKVTKGDLRVSDGNLIVETGSTELQNGLKVTKGDLRVSDGNLIVDNGLTTLSNGLIVSHGLDVYGAFKTHPLDYHQKGLTINEDGAAGINWRDTLFINDEGINWCNKLKINEGDGIQKITLPKSCEVDLKINPDSWHRDQKDGSGDLFPLYQTLVQDVYYKINIKDIYQTFNKENPTLFDGGIFRANLFNDRSSNTSTERIYNLVIDGFPVSSLTYFGVSTILDSKNTVDTHKFNIYFGKTSDFDVEFVKIYEFTTGYYDSKKRMLFSILTDSYGNVIACNHYDKPYNYVNRELSSFEELRNTNN
jgi:hypothetical protein